MTSLPLFVLIALGLVAVALAFLLPPLLRSRERRARTSRTVIDSEIYRQELDELEGEAARGEIGAADARSEREQLRQRFVDEIRAPATPEAPRTRTRTVALAVGVVVPVAAAVLYLAVGKPEALDEQAAPEARAGGDYVEQLRTHLARQPRDGRGWVLLARAQADRNEFTAAADAYQKALTVSDKVAKDPGVLCEYADVLGMAQGGSLAGKPAELIAQALAINPKHPAALEMAGSAAYAEGRYADAVRYWKELLADLSPNSERYGELADAVARAERKAAVSLPR